VDIGLIQIFIGLAGIMVVVLMSLLGFNYWQNRRLEAYYKIIWKKSSELQPDEVMDIRGKPVHGFREYYYERPADQIIRTKLMDSQSILIVGHPLAGKTRALYQALTTGPKPLDVIIPELTDVNPVDFQIPRRLTPWRRAVLLLDDLDKYLEKQNMTYLIQEFIRAGVVLAATCRAGFELQKVEHVLDREMVLFGELVPIPRVDREAASDIARQVGQELPPSFDGNVGSILLRLDAMRDRYGQADAVEQGMLRALKRLYLAGVYREREVFSLARVQTVCRGLEGLEPRQYEWRRAGERLRDWGFVELRDEASLRAEEAYLETVVAVQFSPLDNLRQMLSVFARDPEALFNIGNKSYELGLVDLQKAAYMSLAIAAYEAALAVYTREHSPMDYGMTQNNLGNAYRTLAEVEDKAANCRKAIAAYEAALTVYTRERFTMDYGMTQNNLGTAYGTLAEVEDKAANCRKAIAACEAALTVYTLERFPMDYGMTQNNLGTAYRTLAEMEDQSANCRKAIAACEAALTVYTRERFPMDYGMTQNNLGTAYRTLAEVEDKAANCRKAIAAYEAALTVYTRERFPMQYGMTQNNLGTAYRTLAEVEDKAANCRKAIAAFEESLEIYTPGEFPELYRRISINLEITRRFC
jgi:tetratricopeptide (TPR) repeat protein